MLWLTLNSLNVCDHGGRVNNVVSQEWLTISGVPVQRATDPEGRSITACPYYGATIKPCSKTLPVKTGYSEFIRIDGQRVLLSNLDGLTDGTPPLGVHYKNRNARQVFVKADR